MHGKESPQIAAVGAVLSAAETLVVEESVPGHPDTTRHDTAPSKKESHAQRLMIGSVRRVGPGRQARPRRLGEARWAGR